MPKACTKQNKGKAKKGNKEKEQQKRKYVQTVLIAQKRLIVIVCE